jgi:hypothetical protein
LHGTSDAVYTVANAEREIKLFVRSPDARLEVVEGGQHFLSYSHPKEVDGAVKEFVGKYGKRGSISGSWSSELYVERFDTHVNNISVISFEPLVFSVSSRMMFYFSGGYQMDAYKVSTYILVIENIQDTVHSASDRKQSRQ